MIRGPIPGVAHSDLPVQYVVSSDARFVAAHKAVACDEKQLLHSRIEGELIFGYRMSGGWVAVTKDILTEVLGVGRDAKIVGLPSEAAHVVKLMCPDLVVVSDRHRWATC
jgi:hypothetical protein